MCEKKTSGTGVLRNKNQTGNSKIQKFIKLPTQVSFDNDGNVRRDFRFDHLTSMKEIKLLKMSTIKAAEKPTTTTDDEDAVSSPVFGQKHDDNVSEMDVTHVSETDTSQQGKESSDGTVPASEVHDVKKDSDAQIKHASGSGGEHDDKIDGDTQGIETSAGTGAEEEKKDGQLVTDNTDD